MANFLVVCGGAGRGILREKDRLGFEAVLQVDVYDENLPATDGHSFRVDLPVRVAQHIGLTNVLVLNSFLQNINRRIQEKVEEINKAEQHLAELNANLPDAYFGRTVDQHKVELRNRTHQVESLKKDYDQLCKRREHTDKVKSGTIPASIVNGMSQTPCIGRSYVEDQLPTSQIRQALFQMMGLIDANDSIVTFWVVSSTCGGTGQGVYTHVIDQIHNVMQNSSIKALKIKVVRVGSFAYASISQTVNRNTFWSVLTDYGYIKTHAEKSLTGELHSQLNYYYLDLPVVGNGGKAVQQWQIILPSAFRALTQKHIDRQFEIVFNNIIGAPKVVFARIGEWGKEFDIDSAYNQTINELQQKLKHLLTPIPADVLGDVVAFEKTYSGDSSLDRAAVSERLTLQVVNSLNAIPRPSSSMRVSDIEQRAEWHRIVNFVEQTQPIMVSSGFLSHVRFRIDLHTQNNLSIEFSSATNRTKIFNETYIREVEFAQIAIAKFNQMMTSDHNEESIYNKLIEAYNALRIPGVAGMFASDKNKKERVLANIQYFYTYYAYVSKMLAEYKNATKIVELARHDLSTVTNVISSECDMIKGRPLKQVVTNSAALHETFSGTKTWLQLIEENLRGNPEVARRSQSFRRAVQMGARSLTEFGLKQVLDVPANSSTQQIVAQINKQIGSQGSIWWQGIVPNIAAIPAQFRFNIRLFPQLPEHMFAEMQEENLAFSQNRGIDAPFYIESVDNRQDLKIYGVECIAAGLTITDQFEQLIHQLSGVVNPESTFFQNRDYIAANCMATNGTPVFFPSDVSSHNAALKDVKVFLTETMAPYVTVVTDEFNEQ